MKGDLGSGYLHQRNRHSSDMHAGAPQIHRQARIPEHQDRVSLKRARCKPVSVNCHQAPASESPALRRGLPTGGVGRASRYHHRRRLRHHSLGLHCTFGNALDARSQCLGASRRYQGPINFSSAKCIGSNGRDCSSGLAGRTVLHLDAAVGHQVLVPNLVYQWLGQRQARCAVLLRVVQALKGELGGIGSHCQAGHRTVVAGFSSFCGQGGRAGIDSASLKLGL